MPADTNPCIDCITYAICKSRVIDQIKAQLFPTPKITSLTNATQLEAVTIFIYYLYLEKKCSIIKNHIIEKSQGKGATYNMIISSINKRKKYKTMIYQVMYESFDIKDTIGKESEHANR